MKRRLARVTAVSGALMLLSMSLSGTADANHGAGDKALMCGTTITQDTKLSHDVGPCNLDGLIVGASGTSTDPLVVDLNGFDIFGTPASDGGAGVLIGTRANTETNRPAVGQSHVVVTDTSAAKTSEIFAFDAGVAINGGDHNQVRKLTIRNNGDGFSPSEYGDGIAITDSSHNVISKNEIFANGPLSGVGLYETPAADAVGAIPAKPRGVTAFNVIGGLAGAGNVIRDNVLCFTFDRGTCQTDGVRIEPGVSDTQVLRNVIRGNGLDGVAIFFGNAAQPGNQTDRNIVKANVIEGNGNHIQTHRKGDGVRIFRSPADANKVVNNRICGSGANGIRVDSKSNTISGNRVGDKSTVSPIDGSALPPCAKNHVGPQPGVPPFNYELHDSTATPDDGAGTTCGPPPGNTWTNNTTHVAGQPNHAYNNPCTL